MMDVEIRPARAPQEMGILGELIREYAGLLGEDLCFQGFAEELAALPGAYAPPGGLVLLALVDGRPVGCGAYKDLGQDVCEMKRLYVRPAARGVGLGRRISVELIDRARRQGYRFMRLDTLERLGQALTLYRDLGFRPIAPYYANPLPGVVYLERSL